MTQVRRHRLLWCEMRGSAADRYDDIGERRRDACCVAVGGEDDLLGKDAPSRGDDGTLTLRESDLLHWCVCLEVHCFAVDKLSEHLRDEFVWPERADWDAQSGFGSFD